MSKSENKYTFFWKKSPFSQFYPCNFVVDEIKFNWAEQYMMYSKALLFEDKEIAEQILKATSAKECKALGRKVKNFVKDKWEKVAKDIVYKGNYAKFTQNKKLLKTLLDTGDSLLVESSPYDILWGIGLSESDARKTPPENWPGKNWLGEVLTKLRNNLQLKTLCNHSHIPNEETMNSIMFSPTTNYKNAEDMFDSLGL